MKNTVRTIFAAIGTGVALAVGAYLIKKSFKEELSKIEKESANEENGGDGNKNTEDTKVRDAHKEEETSGDVVVDLLTSLRKNPDWDTDTIDLNRGLVAGSHNIYIRQSVRDLDILLEVPRIGYGNYNLPGYGDFVNGFREATEHIWSNYVKYCDRPFGVLEAYLVLSYEFDDDDKRERHYMWGKLPRDVVAKYRKKDNNGQPIDEKNNWVLTRCVEDLRRQIDEDEFINVGDDVHADTNHKVNIHIEDVILVWRISFRIQTESGPGATGINIWSAEKCLNWLINKFEVRGPRDHNFTYEQLVFIKDLDPDFECWEIKEKQDGGFGIVACQIEY